MGIDGLRSAPSRVSAAYAADDEQPLAVYAALTGVFLSTFGGSLLALRAAGKELPEHIALGDVLLLGLATHKLSRLISKDRVTSFLRAPFTRLQGPAGQGEVSEEPRGSGVQRTIGELLGCPYCLAQWVAGASTVSLIAAPRVTRIVASMYAAQTMSDFLQLVYLLGKESV